MVVNEKLCRVTLCYEDQLGAVTGFGPHRLVVSHVADREIAERIEVERALRDFRPMKGNTKLLRACREDAADITRGGQPLVAVFDDDEVRTLVQLPRSAPDEQVIARIRQGCTAPERVYPVLLRDNTETVLRDILRCDRTIPVALGQQALKKNLNARDLVFRAAAREPNRHVRECILRSNPSLDSIITVLCLLLRGEAPP